MNTFVDRDYCRERHSDTRTSRRSPNSAEERVRVRQKQCVVQLEQLKEYLDALNTRTLSKHPLKKAINYTLKQWLELTVRTTNGYLDDG